MPNYWKHPDIPHKGWNFIEVIDVRDDCSSSTEIEYETCMMCGNEKIRYVHIVEHDKVDEIFRVGCICAEKMTNDYLNPVRRERELKNRSSRLTKWKNKDWKLSKKGNYFLDFDHRHLLIYKDRCTHKYKVKIGEIFGKKTYDTVEKAKIAIFLGIEYLKDTGGW